MRKLVSVLMPAYNAADYLPGAIESVLKQTYSNFELIIVDDGSTDNSSQVVDSFYDARIRLVQSKKNEGLARVRNKLVQLATGDYFAWLDADDLALPERLQTQVEYLENNSAIGFCGSNVKTIGEKKQHIWRYPTDSEEILAYALFANPFATSTLMVRSEFRPILKFSTDFPPAEDYEVWERLLRKTRAINLKLPLTLYRVHPGQTSKSLSENIKRAVSAVQRRQLGRLIQATEQECETHLLLGMDWGIERTREQVNRTQAWLQRLENANQSCRIYDNEAFYRILAFFWYMTCRSALPDSLHALREYFHSGRAYSGGSVLRRSVAMLVTALRASTH